MQPFIGTAVRPRGIGIAVRLALAVVKYHSASAQRYTGADSAVSRRAAAAGEIGRRSGVAAPGGMGRGCRAGDHRRRLARSPRTRATKCPSAPEMVAVKKFAPVVTCTSLSLKQTSASPVAANTTSANTQEVTVQRSIRRSSLACAWLFTGRPQSPHRAASRAGSVTTGPRPRSSAPVTASSARCDRDRS